MHGGNIGQHKGFGHVPDEVIKERCIYLHQLPASERCAFVNSSQCDDASELFQYHYLLFCGIPDPSFDNINVILYIIGMVFLFLVLFLILGITVDLYFCPALGLLSRMLHLSENLSGVTLLAMGNAAPDILTSISSSARGSTILMYNQMLGSGMFVSCVVVGTIVISRPFYLQPYHFLRDVSFALGTIVWVRIATMDGKVVLWEACSFIAIYLIYLLIVIGGYLIQEKLVDYIDIDTKGDVDWTEMRRRTINFNEDDYNFEDFTEIDSTASLDDMEGGPG